MIGRIDFGDFRNPADAAEEHRCADDHQDQGRVMDIEAQVFVAFERTGDRVGLHHIEGDSDGEDEQHREYDPGRFRSRGPS